MVRKLKIRGQKRPGKFTDAVTIAVYRKIDCTSRGSSVFSAVKHFAEVEVKSCVQLKLKI